MSGAMINQTLIFALIGAALLLFVLGRPRYDLVALLVLGSLVLTGLVPGEEAFSGFANPAVISVAAILIVSEGLRRSGFVDYASRWILKLRGGLNVQILVLSVLVGTVSAFMNNIGALAIFMPVALHSAGKRDFPASAILMPMAFASLLGGMTTLIGTPPNMIVSSFRIDASGQPFSLFSFAPVGIGVALAGILFVTLIGWRLLPRRQGAVAGDKTVTGNFKAYLSEVQVLPGSALAGKTLGDVAHLGECRVSVVGHVGSGDAAAGSGRLAAVPLLGRFLTGLLGAKRRLPDRKRQLTPPSSEQRITAGDILVIEIAAADIGGFLRKSGTLLPDLSGVGSPAGGGRATEDAERTVEAVVLPDSALAGKTAAELRLRARYGVSLVAVARQSQPELRRIGRTTLRPGDVLLLKGRADMLGDRLAAMGCLPLADHQLSAKPPRAMLPALTIFAAALALVLTGVLPAHVAFSLAAAAMALAGIIPPRELYQAVDWPVIILLGAMLPLGTALETSGAGATLAGLVLRLGSAWPAWTILGLLLLATMLLSAVINNAATVVLMAPVGISIAHGLGVSVDPFLMAIVVGASASFLTPIAHQSNTLVMGPGGYAFGDYVRLGLPLSLLTLAVAGPLIMFFWPL